MFRPPTRLSVAALLALLLVAAGCAGDDDDDAASGADFCQAVADGEAQADAMFDFGPDATPEDLEAAFNENVSLFENLEDSAPAEIEDDVAAMTDAFRTIRDLGESNDWDLVAMASDPGFAEAFDEAELEEASTALEDYVSANCEGAATE